MPEKLTWDEIFLVKVAIHEKKQDCERLIALKRTSPIYKKMLVKDLTLLKSADKKLRGMM